MPVALSAESVPVIVTTPEVPATVPLPFVPTLMMEELLEVNEVDAVLSVPFRVAVKLIAAPVPVLDRLMVVPKLDVIVSVVD